MIVGISFDTPEENRAFAEAQEFPFRLLSDVDRTVGRAYGAERPADDKYPDFPRRLTFLIDPAGVVRKIYEVTDPGDHPAEVLSDIGEMAGP